MNPAKCKRYKPGKTAVFIVFFILLAFPVMSEENQSLRPSNGAVGTGLTEDGFAAAVVGFFRRHISPIDGDRCPMYPSCSKYSLEVFNKHGLFMGWIMTCDRLLRCGRDELSMAPRIIVDDGSRCYDSVANNDFWRSR